MRSKLSFIPSCIAALLLFVVAIVYIVIPAQAAIVLTSFTATPGDKQITIQWETANEVNINYFNLYRRVNSGSFTRIAGPIAHKGQDVSGSKYSQIDCGLSIGSTYEYQLEIITNDNNSIFTGVISVTLTPTPTPITPSPITPSITPITPSVSPTKTGTLATSTRTSSPTPKSRSYLPYIGGGNTRTPTNTNTPVKTYTPTRTRTSTAVPYRSPTAYIYRTATRRASITPRTATPSRTPTLSTSAAKTATILALTPRTATPSPSRTLTLSTSGAMTATVLAKTPRTATASLSVQGAQTATAMALMGTTRVTSTITKRPTTPTVTTPTAKLSVTPSLTPEPTPSPTPTAPSLFSTVLYKGISLSLGFLSGLILLALAFGIYIWLKRRQKHSSS